MMTEYNKLVDHLVSTMKTNSPVQDVTNSKTDWEDFWYNSDPIHPSISNNINPPIAMETNKQERKSFDELYEEYSAMSIPEQLNNLKRLGRDLFNKLDKIIDQLDDIEKEENKSV